MIFISGVRSIIFQKNKLCTNKICLIYFCPNCVNFLPENVHFFGVFLGTPPSDSHCRFCFANYKSIKGWLQCPTGIVWFYNLLPYVIINQMIDNYFQIRNNVSTLSKLLLHTRGQCVPSSVFLRVCYFEYCAIYLPTMRFDQIQKQTPIGVL